MKNIIIVLFLFFVSLSFGQGVKSWGDTTKIGSTLGVGIPRSTHVPSTFYVNGTMNLNLPGLSNGNVLTTDGAGNATWQPSSGSGVDSFWTLKHNNIVQKDTTKFLGIGTTNPQYSLQVLGAENVTGISNEGAATNFYALPIFGEVGITYGKRNVFIFGNNSGNGFRDSSLFAVCKAAYIGNYNTGTGTAVGIEFDSSVLAILGANLPVITVTQNQYTISDTLGVDHFTVGTASRFISMNDYPNTRNDTNRATTFLYTNSIGNVFTKPIGFPALDSIQLSVVSLPYIGQTYFCTDCTGNAPNYFTGGLVSWTGTLWRRGY